MCDELGHAVSQVIDPLRTVDAGQPGLEMEAVGRQAPARLLLRHVHRGTAVDHRIGGVTEPQLHPGGEHVPHRGPDVHPAVGGGEDVDAVAETPVGQLGDHRIEIFELAAQGGPTIHDQEDVAERVLCPELPGAPGPPVRGDAFHTLAGEQRVPGLHQPVQLGDGAADLVGVTPGGHRAHVRQVGQRGQGAAAEVEAVELGLGRGVRERQAAHERAQEGALAGDRGTNHHDVARRTGQVQPHRVADLLERLVHDADHAVQAAVRPGVVDGEAALRRAHEPGQKLVERGRLGQRRQPDLVGRRALALHPPHQHIQ